MNSTDKALALAARGWAVFPVGQSKRPIISEWTTKASTDESSIRRMFSGYPSCAVGIACGRMSGMFVIDVDSEDENHPIHARLDETFTVRTPSGGFHYYYAMPDSVDDDDVLRNTQKAEACLGYPDVDTRGNGGYVVGPGSVIAGKEYEVICDVDPAQIPTWIVDAMRAYKRRKSGAMVAHKTATVARVVVADGSMVERARRYLSTMKTSVSGQGGHTDAMAAARAVVWGFDLSDSDAMEILREWNQNCSPPWSEKELAHKIADANKQDPKGYPRGHLRRSEDPFYDAPIVSDDEPLEGVIVESEKNTALVRKVASIPEPDDAAQWELLGEVRKLGGLCEAFPRWVLAGADYPQPGLTLGATVALGAAMGQRRWVFDRSTTSSIVVAIAPSASGKGRPQNALAQALREVWPALCGANDLSSTQSTIMRLEAATGLGVGLTLILDEYGPKLKTLFDSRSGHQKEMRALLLTLATINTGAYVAATSATRGGQDRIIVAPGLTILGSTTPEALHDAVGSMAVADGFLGRHLWFAGLSTLPKRQRADAGTASVPREISGPIAACRNEHERWHRSRPEMGDAGAGAPLSLYSPDQMEDAGAVDLLAEYAEHCDERRRHWIEGDVPAELLGRCAEHAGRVAASLAILCCDWGANAWPAVTELMAELAIKIVESSAWTIARSLRDHSKPAWDDPAARTRYVEAAIGRLADADGWVDRSSLLRACRALDAHAMDATLRRLDEEGALESQKVVGKGRPALRLRLLAESC